MATTRTHEVGDGHMILSVLFIFFRSISTLLTYWVVVYYYRSCTGTGFFTQKSTSTDYNINRTDLCILSIEYVLCHVCTPATLLTRAPCRCQTRCPQPPYASAQQNHAPCLLQFCWPHAPSCMRSVPSNMSASCPRVQFIMRRRHLYMEVLKLNYIQIESYNEAKLPHNNFNHKSH